MLCIRQAGLATHAEAASHAEARAASEMTECRHTCHVGLLFEKHGHSTLSLPACVHADSGITNLLPDLGGKLSWLCLCEVLQPEAPGPVPMQTSVLNLRCTTNKALPVSSNQLEKAGNATTAKLSDALRLCPARSLLEGRGFRGIGGLLLDFFSDSRFRRHALDWRCGARNLLAGRGVPGIGGLLLDLLHDFGLGGQALDCLGLPLPAIDVASRRCLQSSWHGRRR